MTRKHFEALAAALRESGEAYVAKVAEREGTAEPADSLALTHATRAHEYYVRAIEAVCREHGSAHFQSERFRDAAALRRMCPVRTGEGVCARPCNGPHDTCDAHREPTVRYGRK